MKTSATLSPTNLHSVPATILAQLGGNRFIAMTGACRFISDCDGLSFRVGSNSKVDCHDRRLKRRPDQSSSTAHTLSQRRIELRGQIGAAGGEKMRDIGVACHPRQDFHTLGERRDPLLVVRWRAGHEQPAAWFDPELLGERRTGVADRCQA